MTLLVGLFLAVLSAGALNWGFFAQHSATRRLPQHSIRRPLRSLRTLFSARRWLAGYLSGIAGWALYVVALLMAPLSLVQATSAGGIGILALLVSRVGGIDLEPGQRVGVAAAIAGLALLGLSAVGQTAATGPGSSIAVGRRALQAGAGYGIGSGLLYSAGDVATKAAIAGASRFAFIPVVGACHLGAFVALQLGFQQGDALATAGLSTVITSALPIMAGVAIYDEPLPHGALGVLRAAAFLGVIVGAALLARPPSTQATRPSPATSASLM